MSGAALLALVWHDIGFLPSSIARFIGLTNAMVVDADTLDIDGQRIRLHGIDGPELRQWCEIDGWPYPCGALAAVHLRRVVAHGTLTCTERARDAWQRSVAVCRLPDGTDVGRQMVRDGHAMAFVRYSADYQADERHAQAARAGIWRGEFVAPWDWR